MSQETNVVDSIFGSFGNILDGAQSILGDYLEFDLLKTEIEAQRRGTASADPVVYQNAAPTNSTGGSSGGNNSTLIMAGAAVFALLGFLVLSD